jgi:ABC-type bacteriocin/lantibiotic exporter with double-glycine peptidase domain
MSLSVSLLLLGFGCGGSPPGEGVEQKYCGRHAIALVTSFVTGEEPSQVWDHLLPVDRAPFSLSELEQAAREAGFDTALVRWSDFNAAVLDCPCILYIKTSRYSAQPDHFIACLGSKDSAVCLADYPRWPSWVARENLRDVWSGVVLYVDRPGSSTLARLQCRLWRQSAVKYFGMGLAIVSVMVGLRVCKAGMLYWKKRAVCCKTDWKLQ